MRNNTNLCYSKIHLRNRLMLYKTKTEAETRKQSEYIALIAESINNNKEFQLTEVSEGKTKVQLFTLGFSASQIQNYFEFRAVSKDNSYMRWFLKKYLIVNGQKINTIKDLTTALEINLLKNVG